MDEFRFCFTLDTEPDDLWANRPVLGFEHFQRLCGFHEELTIRGARATYLTTSEVVEHPPAARVMADILATGQAEIGAHFHTWTRQWPFPVPDLGTPPVHATAQQLGQQIEEAMLEYTCQSLDQALGVHPVSYRGGRWSLNRQSVRSLRNCGIQIDSTVTPGLNWIDRTHALKSGPDFRDFPREPFYLAEDVLELPVGAAFIPDQRRATNRGVVARIVRRVSSWLGRPCGHVWLRPTLMSRRQMRACLESLRRDRVPIWVAMIHSSEIAPNRYFPTETAVAAFRRRCLHLVEDAIALGARGATLEEAARQQEVSWTTNRTPDLCVSSSSPAPMSRAAQPSPT